MCEHVFVILTRLGIALSIQQSVETAESALTQITACGTGRAGTEC